MPRNQAKGSPKVANLNRSKRRRTHYKAHLRERITALNKELKDPSYLPHQVKRREIKRDKLERLLDRNHY